MNMDDLAEPWWTRPYLIIEKHTDPEKCIYACTRTYMHAAILAILTCFLPFVLTHFTILYLLPDFLTELPIQLSTYFRPYLTYLLTYLNLCD